MDNTKILEEIKVLKDNFNSIFEVTGSEFTDEVEQNPNKISIKRKDKKTKEPVEMVSVADELFPYEGTAKEQLNQKILAKINDMLQGTATLEDLINLVKKGRAHESLEQPKTLKDVLTLAEGMLENLNGEKN